MRVDGPLRRTQSERPGTAVNAVSRKQGGLLIRHGVPDQRIAMRVMIKLNISQSASKFIFLNISYC
jgi:hypothetical protein